MKDKLVLSFSSMSDFARCPKKFYFDKENKKEMKQIQQDGIGTLGQFCHLFFKKYVDHLVAINQSTDISVVDKLIEETKQEFDVILTIEDYKEAEEIMRSFADEMILDPKTVISTEKFYNISKKGTACSYFDDDALFCGVADLVQYYDGVLTITDYKTGWAKNKDQTQIIAYALLVMAEQYELKIEKIIGRFHYTRFNYIEDFELSKEDLREFHKWIKFYYNMILNAYATNKFPAKANSNCEYCMYSHVCFKNIKFDNEKNVMSNEFIENNYFGLKALIAKQEKALKTYFESDGEIFWREGLWTKKESIKFELKDPKEIYDLLKALEIDPFKYFKMTKTNIQNMIKDVKKVEPELKESLNQCYNESTSWTFDFVKDTQNLLTSNPNSEDK